MSIDNYMQSFLDTPEPEIDEEYFTLEREFEERFSHTIPTEILPPNITSERLKEVMRWCIDHGEDKASEQLGIAPVDIEGGKFC